jgi:pimeloyl-ACP methyl ester carboxylesterase
VPDKPITADAHKKSRFLSWRTILLFFYIALLLTSYVLRWFGPPEDRTLSPVQSRVLVPEVDRDHFTQRKIELAYADFPAVKTTERTSGGAGDHLPVLLVHGSPGEGGDFDDLAKLMVGKRRLIAPDLPGFGNSTHDIKDYSFKAHAMYLWELLDQLGIQKVHLVGWSMGGGVVLHMANSAPQRVA